MNDLSERFLDFAVEIIKLVSDLPRTLTGRHIGKQLVNSSTSAGANYEEALRGSKSR
jgi:four helix bundle protein